MEYGKIMWRLRELSGKTDRIRYELETNTSLCVKGLRGTRCPNGRGLEEPPNLKQECIREINHIIQDAEDIRKILKELTE